MRTAVVGVLAATMLAACSPEAAPRADGREAAPEARPTLAEREPTKPKRKPRRPRVRNVAVGASHRHVRRAIRDLERIGVWRRLTRGLYVVNIQSRPGRLNVPDDRHMADAYLTAVVERRGGPMCDVMFYPAALRADLQRQAIYAAQGRLLGPLPTLRQFWAAVLAHELAHCRYPGKGEAPARRWEEEVLERWSG